MLAYQRLKFTLELLQRSDVVGKVVVFALLKRLEEGAGVVGSGRLLRGLIRFLLHILGSYNLEHS